MRREQFVAQRQMFYLIKDRFLVSGTSQLFFLLEVNTGKKEGIIYKEE